MKKTTSIGRKYSNINDDIGGIVSYFLFELGKSKHLGGFVNDDMDFSDSFDSLKNDEIRKDMEGNLLRVKDLFTDMHHEINDILINDFYKVNTEQEEMEGLEEMEREKREKKEEEAAHKS